MSEGLYGLIGVIVGALLTPVVAAINDNINRRKKLHLEIRLAKFDYPYGIKEEPLTGKLVLYVYNESTLPKTFVLESLKLKEANITFIITGGGQRDLASNYVHRIEPNNGIKQEYNLSIHPDWDFDIPNIENKKAVLTYTSGKERYHVDTKLSYFNIN